MIETVSEPDCVQCSGLAGCPRAEEVGRSPLGASYVCGFQGTWASGSRVCRRWHFLLFPAHLFSLFIPVLFPFPPLPRSNVPEFKIQMRFAHEMGHFDGIWEYRVSRTLSHVEVFRLRVEYCVTELV